MFYAGNGLDSYNKSTHSGQGTLIQNWQEERVLREETGIGRTFSKTHISKQHEDLFRKAPQDLGSVYSQNSPNDETFGRVFGRAQEPNYTSENKDKFAKRNPYQEPVYGKKYQTMEKEFIESIKDELQEKGREEDEFHNQRSMNTTYGNQFTQKDVQVNVVGRRVMRDQNGKSLVPDRRDEDLLVDHGFLKPSALASEQELQAAVKKDSYVTAQPYTFWAEKAKDGAYYKSSETHDGAPFTKNNDFLKTFSNYTHKKL